MGEPKKIMKDEKLIMNNEQLPVGAAWHAAQKHTDKNNLAHVGAGLVSAQKNKYKNNGASVGACIARPAGITLIALIITIIVMLILAGVVLSLTIGERGIFNTAKVASEKTSEANAREKLELVLVDLQTDKITDVNYNENGYINQKIQENGMVVNGDIILVDGWQFQIDRSIPEIVISLGKGEESQKIEILAAVENAKDYTKATIKVEITATGEISSIQIGGEEITIPEKTDGKYIIEKEVTQNGNYTIYVKDKADGYKIANANVTEISEDMDIYTVEELVAFEKKANKGATFEGRTIRLKNDLDLSSIEWKPIGYYVDDNDCIVFKGTFDGEYHIINNMKINMPAQDECSGVGFIGALENGTIKNLNFNNPNVYSEIWSTGIAVGYTISNNTDNKPRIQNISVSNGQLVSTNERVGGICGTSVGIIMNCYNNANVSTQATYIGGICGFSQSTSIENCYNTGTVTSTGKNAKGNSFTGGIVGALGDAQSTIQKCYNVGEVTAKYSYVGGIAGKIQTTATNVFNAGNVRKETITASATIGESPDFVGTLTGGFCSLSVNCGNTTVEDMQGWDEDTIKENLGEGFKKNDDSNVNQGLPLLEWQ